MKTIMVLALVFFIIPVKSQDLNLKKNRGGIISLGGRNSIGIVNDGKWRKPGFGTGGHFRLQFSDRVNSEWFIEYLTANISDYAWKADTHIGWSVLYYLTNKPEAVIQPYLLAGHCFEHLKYTDNFNSKNFAERWSASLQGGVGTHFNITRRFDISLVAHYMIHLGTKIFTSNVEKTTTFTKKKGAGIHDHILLNISLNYKIADLW